MLFCLSTFHSDSQTPESDIAPLSVTCTLVTVAAAGSCDGCAGAAFVLRDVHPAIYPPDTAFAAPADPGDAAPAVAVASVVASVTI